MEAESTEECCSLACFQGRGQGLFYRTQYTLLGMAATHSWLGPPTSVSHQGMPTDTPMGRSDGVNSSVEVHPSLWC